MDLTCGHDFLIETSQTQPIDPYNFDREKLFIRSSLPYNISPGERLLLYALEDIEIPDDAWGFIQVRSTFARLGFMSPPTIADPGFHGNITLELYNASNNKIKIRPFDRIWSLNIVRAVMDAEVLYNGRYQGQLGVTAPKPLNKTLLHLESHLR